MTQPYLEPALACIDRFYEQIFRNWPDSVTRVIDGCILSYSGDTRLTGANHLWPQSPDALTPGILEEANVFFHQFHAAWSVLYTDTYMPLAAPVLQDYYPRWNSPVMVLDAAPYRLAPHPGAQVIRATTAQHLADVEQVMFEAFATSAAVNRRVVRPAHLDDPAIAHYIIYARREPAACATVVLSDSMAGIWNVGTRYRFRRQRYATTIMLGVLDELREHGYPVSMLMASPNGQPLYERLGYQQIGTTYYMGPPYFSRARFDRQGRSLHDD